MERDCCCLVSHKRQRRITYINKSVSWSSWLIISSPPDYCVDVSLNICLIMILFDSLNYNLTVFVTLWPLSDCLHICPSTSSNTLSSWLWYLTFWLTKSKQLLSFWLISFIHLTALPCQSSSLLGLCLLSSLSFWSVAIHSGWLCHWTFQQIFVALFIFFSFLYRII